MLQQAKPSNSSAAFDIVAPMAALDIEDWLDLTAGLEDAAPSDADAAAAASAQSGNMVDSGSTNGEQSDLYNSLEDLVKTFDQSVKKCLSNYKDVDVGQLAPVQVRAPEDIINDSPIWYTLTGNFGNLLPIDYWSKSLLRKYHHRSLSLTGDRKSRTKSDELANSDSDSDDGTDISDEEDEEENEETVRREAAEADEDYLAFDEEEDELREQLDMHSMILAKNEYNQSAFEEPLLTAEQVLNEIDTMMMMQEEYYDEMTPDSGCFSVQNSASFSNSNINDLCLDLNASYLKYIGTFAEQDQSIATQPAAVVAAAAAAPLITSPFKLDRSELDKLNVYELGELVEQIELFTTELSDTLVQELALRDELEFEKETRNTFISLIMSIQEKRRMLNLDSYSPSSESGSSSSVLSRHSSSFNIASSKKKNRRSLINFNLDFTNPTHLTTVIPYNSEIEYTVQHLQILNKLLKAINEDSHQVPELLTNYILKVVCPT